MPTTHDEPSSDYPAPFEILRTEPPLVEAAEIDAPIAGDLPATMFLDWDRERYPGAVPRRMPLPADEPGPTWLAFPHARYVLCARHRAGRIEHVCVTSLLGRRDSLFPPGDVERIVTDDRSVTVVVDGRPYLYVVGTGGTIDLTLRRVIGPPLPGGTSADSAGKG